MRIEDEAHEQLEISIDMKKIFVIAGIFLGIAFFGFLGYNYFLEPLLARKRTLDKIEKLEAASENIEIDILDRHLVSFLIRHINHEEPSNSNLLVFIHGYNGHPFATWGQTIEGLCQGPYEREDLAWLRQFDIMSLSYPTGLGHGRSIKGAASRFKQPFKSEAIGRGYQNIYIIAHSMGGLVVQRALLDEILGLDKHSQHNELPRLKAIIYIDTPHDGLTLRDENKTVKWFLAIESETSELKAGSAFRQKLHQDWTRAFAEYPEHARRYFQERAWIFESDETAQNLVVVKGQKYRHFPDAKEQTVSGTTHSGICKTSMEEFLNGKGYFHKFIVSLLGRHEFLTGFEKKPFGVSHSRDRKWIYIISQNDKDEEFSTIRRINAKTGKRDPTWESKVGASAHDFVEVESKDGLIGIVTDEGDVAEEGDSGLTLVDLETGKVIRRVQLGNSRPDDMDVHADRFVAVSDAETGHIWIYDAVEDIYSTYSEVTGDGTPYQIRGLQFIRNGTQLIACGDRGFGSPIARLFLYKLNDLSLEKLSEVRTGNTPAQVVFIEEKNFACVVSHKGDTILIHPLNTDEISHISDLIRLPASTRPADIATLEIGDEVLCLIACHDGTAKKMRWENGDPVIFSYEHGAGQSYGIGGDAEFNRVYVANDRDGIVTSIDLSSRQWVRQPPSTSLIIDTDPALGLVIDENPQDVDDSLAIVEAINSPKLNLIGITTVFGNSPPEKGAEIARKLVGLKKKAVEVVAGAAEKAPPEGKIPTNPAVDLMAKKLRTRKIIIAAIGPLTNVASLIQNYPDRCENIQQIVAVMGRSPGQEFYLGDRGPIRDFNFAMDPRAAEIVLTSGIPVVLVPFELTSTVTISQSDLDLIRDAETESSQYVFEGCKKWMTFWRENFPSDDGFHPWDSATIAYLTSQELFVPEVRGFRIRSVDGTAHGVGNAKTGKLSDSQRWLELSPDFPNGQIEYITHFRDGGGKEFVRQIVESVY